MTMTMTMEMTMYWPSEMQNLVEAFLLCENNEIKY